MFFNEVIYASINNPNSYVVRNVKLETPVNRDKRQVVYEINKKNGISTRWPNKTIPYEFSNFTMPSML